MVWAPRNKQLKSGFTIVELLIVVVVIAILAAIVIVAYNGISNRAKQAAAQSTAEQVSKKLLNYAVDNSESFPSTLATLGFVTSSDTVYEYTYDNGVSPRTFCVSVTFQGFSSRVSSTSPTPDTGLCPGHIGAAAPSGWSRIAMGTDSQHICGIYNGLVYCWGNNSNGQLGNNTTTAASTPVAVTASGVLNGKTITDIAVGSNVTCVIANNWPYCWGQGASKQLGNNGTTDSLVPVAVVDSGGVLTGKTISKIVSTGYVGCVLANGATYCWGNQTNLVNSLVPIALNSAGPLAGKIVTDLSAGVAHVCAVAEGNVYCLGYGSSDNFGQLGQGTNLSGSSSFLQVSTATSLSGKTVTSVGTGWAQSCVTTSDGLASCWGYGPYGQLGDGAGSTSYSPVAVDITGVLAGKTITKLDSGSGNSGMSHTCAIASGKAYCWGAGYPGQYWTLGDPASSGSYIPIAVSTTSPSAIPAADTVTDITVGAQRSCLIASGNVYCWGRNNVAHMSLTGVLGSGSATQATTPVQVVNP